MLSCHRLAEVLVKAHSGTKYCARNRSNHGEWDSNDCTDSCARYSILRHIRPNDLLSKSYCFICCSVCGSPSPTNCGLRAFMLKTIRNRSCGPFCGFFN